MKMVYVSVSKWKLFLDLNWTDWKLQWSGREISCTLCRFVRNVFGEWLAGERKLPGLEARRYESCINWTWSSSQISRKLQTSAVCDSCPPDRSFPSWSFLTWKMFIIFQAVAVTRFHSITPSLFVRHLENRQELPYDKVRNARREIWII